MREAVKLGLIGAGSIAKAHLEALRTIDWIKAAGITSRTMTKAEALAREYNIPACHQDIDSLVKNANPDGLMVLVSEDQMFKVTKDAMKYRLPLFVEKPAGLLPEDNRRLAIMARKKSISNMVGFNRRYYSIFHKGLEVIRKHGPLLGVFVEGHERMWRVRQLNRFSEYVLDNWIFANSVHTIDLLRFFGGEVKNVSSRTRSHIERKGDQFAAIMELESGAIGQYSAHWYSPGGWRVVLYGDGITVEFKPLESARYTDKNFNVHELAPDDADLQCKPGFRRQMEAFGKLIREGNRDWPMQDLEGSYRTMLLAKKIREGRR